MKHQSVSRGLSHKFWSTVGNIIIIRKQAHLCDTPSPWQPPVFISGTPKLCVPCFEDLGGRRIATPVVVAVGVALRGGVLVGVVAVFSVLVL